MSEKRRETHQAVTSAAVPLSSLPRASTPAAPAGQRAHSSAWPACAHSALNLGVSDHPFIHRHHQHALTGACFSSLLTHHATTTHARSFKAGFDGWSRDLETHMSSTSFWRGESVDWWTVSVQAREGYPCESGV